MHFMESAFFCMLVIHWLIYRHVECLRGSCPYRLLLLVYIPTMSSNQDVEDLVSLQLNFGDDSSSDVNWVGPGPTKTKDNADLVLAQAVPEVIWCSYSPPKKAKTIKGAESTPGSGGGTAPSAGGGASTGGTVGGRRDMQPSEGNTKGTGSGCAGEGLLNFKKKTQNGRLKCSQCRRYIQGPSHKWMPYRGAGCHGPGVYYCHVTKKRGWEAWC